MKLNHQNLYKLVETDGLIALMRFEDRITSMQSVELIGGNITDINEYLPVYLHERSRGATIKQAHATALRGARIIGENNIEKVPDDQMGIAQ